MIDTNRPFKKELKFIKDFDIPYTVLAKVLGINRSGVSDKINGTNNARFTDTQKDLISAYIKKIGKAASKI